MRIPRHCVVASGSSVSVPAGPMNEMRNRWRLRISVAGAVNGEEARVVTKALFDENVECPLGARRDREVRRAKAPHGRTGMLLENRLRDAHVFAKLLRRERVHAAMPMPVRRDLVSGIDDAPHQERMALGDPSEREKGRARVMSREQLEQDADGMLEAAGLRVPIFPPQHTVESADLEIFFHVDGKDVLSGAVNRQAHTERHAARKDDAFMCASKSCS